MEEQQREHPLKQGQTWKLEHGYLHIVELGKRLVQYKLLKQSNEHTVTTRMIGIVELIIFLRHNEAELMNERNQLGNCLI
jgi:hypothetical protein